MKRYIRSSRILTNYFDSDTIHSFMSRCKGFGEFDTYQILDDMMAKTTKITEYPGVGPHGAVHGEDRFWKFILNDDGNLEAYEIRDGVQVGDTFVVKKM